MSHIDRTKSESDIVEHVFNDVLAREESSAHFPIVEIDVTRGFVASTRSTMEVDVLAEPSHEPTRER